MCSSQSVAFGLLNSVAQPRSGRCTERAGITKACPRAIGHRARASLRYPSHDDLRLVPSTLGLHLALVPPPDDRVTVDQPQGGEIEVSSGLPRAPFSELELPFMLSAAPLLEIQSPRFAVTTAVGIIPGV